MDTLEHSRNAAQRAAARTVGDAMNATVIRCTPDTPLCEVAGLMSSHAIHGVYVFAYADDDAEVTSLWGLVSDLDLVAAWPVIEGRTAGENAVTPLVTVSREEPLEAAAQLMVETATTHLAVLDPSTRLPVGVLSTIDIAHVIAARHLRDAA
jgi:CBS domain-containing protein